MKSYDELITIVPIYKSPNKFYWTGKVTGAGDSSGDPVILTLSFQNTSMFGGHWLWDLEGIDIETNQGSGTALAEFDIYSAMNVRPVTAEYILRRRIKLSAAYNACIMQQADYPLDDIYKRKYKPTTAYPRLVVVFDTNTNGLVYTFMAHGFIFNEELEALVGNSLS